jgi:hypothetical protein
VLVSVLLGGLVMVVLGVKVMPMRYVRVMSSFLVVAGFVMLRGFLVVTRGMFVVFGGVPMMLGCRFVVRHNATPICAFKIAQSAYYVSMKHLQDYS